MSNSPSPPPSISNDQTDVQRQAKLAELREQSIGRLLLQAYRHFTALAICALRERGHAGLSLTHASLLVNLDADGTRIVALAERAGMTKQSMGQLVADLEQKGYVARSADPLDRRAVQVVLTDAGWRYVADAAEIKCELEAAYATVLGEEGLRGLRASLKTLVTRDDRCSDP